MSKTINCMQSSQNNQKPLIPYTCSIAMDTVINARCDVMRNLIEENDIYALCGINPFAQIHDLASQVTSDLRMYFKHSWGKVNYKYSDMLIYMALMKRRAQIKDVEGLKWCLDQVTMMQSKNAFSSFAGW